MCVCMCVIGVSFRAELSTRTSFSTLPSCESPYYYCPLQTEASLMEAELHLRVGIRVGFGRHLDTVSI